MKNFKLDEHEKIKAPFEVPDGYFTKLNEEILAKTVNAPVKKEAKQVWFTPFKLAVAAAITLMAVSSVLILTNTTSDQSAEQLLAEVSNDDILYYLEQSEITEEEIITGLDLNDFELMDETSLDNLDLDNMDLDEIINDLDIIEDI